MIDTIVCLYDMDAHNNYDNFVQGSGLAFSRGRVSTPLILHFLVHDPA